MNDTGKRAQHLNMVATLLLCLYTTLLSAQVVINEIHYEPADNSQATAFIELINTGSSPIDLSDWQIDEAISFCFPTGTMLPPQGTLVVAENPQALWATFGATSLGPWIGQLNRTQDEILLRKASGEIMDRVDYRLGFPWPTSTQGRSLELIHPNLDNDLGGHWRASGYGLPSAQQAPTPGQPNSVWSLHAPPNIHQVDHHPQQPHADEPIVITAKITDPNGLRTKKLSYQIVNPGAYIAATLPLTRSELQTDGNQPRRENPDYHAPENWHNTYLFDDGTGMDEKANDEIYTGVIPGQPHRTLVRYRLSVTNTDDQSIDVPYQDDPARNFACWVYDGVPAYTADTQSRYGAPHSYSSDLLTQLPVYHLVTHAADLNQCLAYQAEDQIAALDHPGRFAYNWQGTLIYNGQVYDHIDYRLRGGQDRYDLQGKRNMTFRFLRAHGFAAQNRHGDSYAEPWPSLQVSRQFDKQAVNGSDNNFGLPEAINAELWNLMGVPTARTHWFHLRVVDDAAEASDQYHGDFWGLFLAMEDHNSAFLKNHDLREGNLYQLTPGLEDPLAQQRHQGQHSVNTGQDVLRLYDRLAPERTEIELQNLIDYDHFFRYFAVCQAVRHYDFETLFADRNQAYYFLPQSPDNPLGTLWYLPWNTGLSWGPNANQGMHEAWWALGDDGLAQTEDLGGQVILKRHFRNTLREMRSLLWNPETINPLLDELAASIADFTEADRDRWTQVPAWAQDAGSHNSFTHSVADKVADMKTFAWQGHASWPSTGMEGSLGDGGQTALLDQIAWHNDDANQIPNTPSIRYLGTASFPIDDLHFAVTAFDDPQGNHTFAAQRWRIAEVSDPQDPDYDPSKAHYEYQAVWESGNITPYTETITLPLDNLRIGRRYRVRARFGDQAGHWSNWSAPLEFVTSPPLDGSLRDGLRVTELMYHPADPPLSHPNAEFVELSNMGTQTIDLSRVRLRQAVSFDFTSGILHPGDYVLVVRDLDTFAEQYGNDLPVAGAYSKNLSNSHDTLILKDSLGQLIQKVEYEDTWYPLTDGQGFSLVPSYNSALPPEASTAEDWRSSAQFGGSPGQDDTVKIPASGSILISEILAHSHGAAPDWIELYNTTHQSLSIGGWFLSDNDKDLTKYQIADGTIIPAQGYVVLYEHQHFGNPADPGAARPFALSENGETLYLTSGYQGVPTSYRMNVSFGASETGVSFGRWITSSETAHFVLMSFNTPGAANATPLTGPVIISEIMYHPAGDGDAEYIELYNISSAPVLLYNAATQEAWRFRDNPEAPTLDYTFVAVQDIILHPSEHLILTRDQSTFVKTFDVPTGVKVYDWGPGGLSNAGETLQLCKSGDVDEHGRLYWVEIDRVTYSDGTHPLGADPWPPEADGNGLSLQRIKPQVYGNDASNWQADVPNPGL